MGYGLDKFQIANLHYIEREVKQKYSPIYMLIITFYVKYYDTIDYHCITPY